MPKVGAAAAEISRQVRQPVDPQQQVKASLADINAIDQQPNDARLLSREEFVSKRIEVLQGTAHLIFAPAVVGLRP